MICSDIIDNFEVNGLRVAIWSLVAAMHHYFCYAEEYIGEDERERLLLNEQIQNNRQDAFWNLKRFARNAEMHCSSKVLTTQLHTLLCRLPSQEKAQGCVAEMGEIFMERGVCKYMLSYKMFT